MAYVRRYVGVGCTVEAVNFCSIPASYSLRQSVHVPPTSIHTRLPLVGMPALPVRFIPLAIHWRPAPIQILFDCPIESGNQREPTLVAEDQRISSFEYIIRSQTNVNTYGTHPFLGTRYFPGKIIVASSPVERWNIAFS